jgi:hypothetical protein
MGLLEHGGGAAVGHQPPQPPRAPADGRPGQEAAGEGQPHVAGGQIARWGRGGQGGGQRPGQAQA